ncbi:MAG: hypothetical protein QF546_07290 [Alphaproteobacteria bacterium]|nr:hypothetical protein [Alphaproteobacteria bacterium]HJP20590.1 hypothetical protein [Alphaproteobacteria bacterium]
MKRVSFPRHDEKDRQNQRQENKYESGGIEEHTGSGSHIFVIPAKAGTQVWFSWWLPPNGEKTHKTWVPAFAGMTP